MTYDMSIHQNPDAHAWAKFFIETQKQTGFVIDEELMIGWFANAMMAMHDHLILPCLQRINMKRNHKHAEMIRRWLDDDSLIVETTRRDGNWVKVETPNWDEAQEYRFKPKMIKVNGHEFPEPKHTPISPILPSYAVCIGINYNSFRIAGYHETQEAAEAHARALISLTEVRE